MARGKHADNRMVLFASKQAGKHAKNELIKYNPIQAKLNAGLGTAAMVISFLTCMTFGRFKGTLAGNDTARVARYALELSEPETSITEFIPNTTRNVEFEVKNFKGTTGNSNNTSEVKIKYRVIVELPITAQLPIDYTLYRVYDDDREVEVTLTDGRTDYIEVGTTSEIHKYRLKMEWQSGRTDIKYQNLKDDVRILVESEQVD